MYNIPLKIIVYWFYVLLCAVSQPQLLRPKHTKFRQRFRSNRYATFWWRQTQLGESCFLSGWIEKLAGLAPLRAATSGQDLSYSINWSEPGQICVRNPPIIPTSFFPSLFFSSLLKNIWQKNENVCWNKHEQNKISVHFLVTSANNFFPPCQIAGYWFVMGARRTFCSWVLELIFFLSNIYSFLLDGLSLQQKIRDRMCVKYHCNCHGRLK